MIGYTCKYTPVELLEALGGDCCLLNGDTMDFFIAESETHNTLCCHAKALLQHCKEKKVRELVLVNCCDSIRRCYDVLLEQKTMDFLFFLDLPHDDNICARILWKKELLRLLDAYSDFKGTAFDRQKFLHAFVPAAPPMQTPFLAVLGGRISDGLKAQIAHNIALPVEDLTCGGNRRVEKPADGLPLDALMDRYAQALLRQIPCMRMNQIGRRQELYQNPKIAGILYHTVKFCDYYAFEYETIRTESGLPILKIESDFTTQSTGQLSTRLEAFMEHLQPTAAIPKAKQSPTALYAGIDSGSTTTNMVVMNQQGDVVASAIVRTGPKALLGANKALEQIKESFGITAEQLQAVVATGYGRNNIGFATQTKTEITCHAKGAYHLNPSIRTIVDIGGQDSKVICLNPDGSVKNFVMNDKCAAGTGRFLEMMARTLELDLPRMSQKGLTWKEELTISSMCTVFAESEVISLIADNKAEGDIIHGLNLSVASKTAALVSRANGQAGYMMTGGVARNQGVVKALEAKLHAPLFIAEKPDLCGALGAALFAMET